MCHAIVVAMVTGDVRELNQLFGQKKPSALLFVPSLMPSSSRVAASVLISLAAAIICKLTDISLSSSVVSKGSLQQSLAVSLANKEDVDWLHTENALEWRLSR